MTPGWFDDACMTCPSLRVPIKYSSTTWLWAQHQLVSIHAPKSNTCDARVLRCFPDSLLAWTFYCSSDSLSTELQGHCIAREMSTHSPLSVYHLLYSILIPQHPVSLASMSPNHSHQHPQHPRASPVAPFSPHLKDCPPYSRKLFCFSSFFL